MVSRFCDIILNGIQQFRTIKCIQGKKTKKFENDWKIKNFQHSFVSLQYFLNKFSYAEIMLSKIVR